MISHQLFVCWSFLSLWVCLSCLMGSASSATDDKPILSSLQNNTCVNFFVICCKYQLLLLLLLDSQHGLNAPDSTLDISPDCSRYSSSLKSYTDNHSACFFYTFSIIYLEIVVHVYGGQGNGVAPPVSLLK